MKKLLLSAASLAALALLPTISVQAQKWYVPANNNIVTGEAANANAFIGTTGAGSIPLKIYSSNKIILSGRTSTSENKLSVSPV